MSRVFYVHRGVPTTYAQFAALVGRRAAELAGCRAQVVGLWADHDPDFLINLFAIWQAGGVPLLLSRRLSWNTVSALLDRAAATFLLTPDVESCSPCRAAVLSSRCASSALDAGLPEAKPEIGAVDRDVALILHTSGTTSLPKLVSVRRAHLHASLELLRARWADRWTDRDGSLGWLPLFHSYGLISEVLYTYSVQSRYHFASANPVEQLGLLQEQPGAITLLFTVPWMLRQLLDLPGGLEACQRLRFVVVGGALVGEDLGERLRAAGVRLVQNYGMTELGPVFLGPLEGGDWRDLHPIVPERFFHLEDGSSQLVVQADCPTLCSSPAQQFATGDVFQRAPSGAYRYVSRCDDLLVHENGEKSNALVIEHLLSVRLRALVQQVAVFGRGRLNVACVLQWKREPTAEDHQQVQQALDQINPDLPSHSRLQRHMILHFTPGGEHHLPLTPKGSLMRNKAELELEPLLDSLYERGGEPATGATVLSSVLSFFPRPEEVERDVSLFDQGLDSIQAMHLRNHIARLHPERHVPQQVVYQHPTLERLERYLEGRDPAPPRPPRFAPFSGEERAALRREQRPARHVLLTGATGFVGRHLLEALSRCDHVERISCLVRTPPEGPPSSGKVRYYGGYSFLDPHLGLSASDYRELQETSDTIVHCAWPVNFNATYEQLAEAALGSVRSLLELARAGDKSFHFLSTVGTVMLHPQERRVDEVLPSPTDEACFPHGYSQTKWEAEQLLVRSGMRHKIYRLGQISAHSVTGRWKRREHIPILLTASRQVGVTPLLPQPLDWVPVDIACRAIVELMSVSGENVHHIVNPNPRPAESLARGGAVAPLLEWLTKVEPQLSSLPQLLGIWPFLRQLAAAGERLASLRAEATCRHSRVLAACEPISDAYLARVAG